MTATTDTMTDIRPDATFRTSRLAEAVAKIETANRRLARNGITGRFQYATVERLVAETVHGIPTGVLASYTDLYLNAPAIAYSGWTFLATLVHEDAGVITRNAPGQTLDGYVPSNDRVCEHCGTARARRDTFIVRHADGTVRQIGRNCLTAFLGIKPSGLWALGYDFDFSDTDDDDREPSYGSGDYRVTVRAVIAAALGASNNGLAFRSKGSCEFGGTPTSMIVSTILFSNNRKDREELAEQIAATEAVTDEQISAVLDAVNAMSDDSDYARNMKILAASESIDTRNLGMLVSAVAVWNRAEQRKVEYAARPVIAAGFLGDAGDKLTGLPVTVTGVREIEGDYGTTTLLTMVTADGHQVKWFASNAPEAAVLGATLTVRVATVKGHDVYQGVDSTLVKLVKFAA